MERDRWDRVKELFEQAVDLPPDERPVYLDAECAADLDLRRELADLLESHNSSGVLDLSVADFAALLPQSDIQAAFSTQQIVSERFRIVRFIGRGGMGEVYEAEDMVLGGSVALKTLRPEFVADNRLVRRFRREVLLARMVTHPNVCRVFDMGVDRGGNKEVAYLTMEYLEGDTLSTHLKRKGRLSPEDALPLIRQMAGGLEALHKSQIVHRDFKPGNVILTEDSSGVTRAVITDFGLARRAAEPRDGGTRVSFSGQVFGTPDYMAPEQLSGKPVTAATDVYALGLVMYEMVTGAKPFREGEALETAVQRVTESPVPPSEHAPNLPEALEQTIVHCLEKEPAERPAGAAEVIERLDPSGDSGLFHPRQRSGSRPRIPVPSPLRSRFRRGPLLAASAVFSILVALLAWTTRSSRMGDALGENERLHVAVLPFSVLSENAQLRAFADGLMESLTSGLSQYEGLNNNLLVVPASEVQRLKVISAADARERFNVNYAVKGTLEMQGERVRLQLVLIDTEQMRQLETARVEEVRLKALNLQDGALARLGNLLDLAVRPEHASDQSSLAPGAYEFYLQGLGYLQRSDKTENLSLAVSLFERALELDGEYALGYAGLAESYWRLYDRTAEAKWIELALSNCERALELNAQLPKVLVTAGQVYSGTGRFEDALRAFTAALEVDSRNWEAFEGLAGTYTLMERYSDAEATHQKAIMLRPGDWRTHFQLASFYFRRNRFDKAIESFRRVVSLTPDSSQAHSNLAVALHRAGQLDEARAMYERSIEIEARPKTISGLGALLSSQGHREEALRLYERAVEIDSGDHGLWANLGSAYDAMGDTRTRGAFLKAAAIVEEMLRVNPERSELHSTLAHYFAGAGDRTRAERSLKNAEQRQSPSPEELANNAATCAKLGRLDRAFVWAEQALGSGYPAADLAKRRWLAPLMKDPNFQALLRHFSGGGRP